jgi:hypothetical protein
MMVAIHLYADEHEGAAFPGYARDAAVRDDMDIPLAFPANARYPWRLVPYLAGSMDLLYAGRNRATLSRLRGGDHPAYAYAASVFPSLGINAYFFGGHETEFPAAKANARFGEGTVVTRVAQSRHPSDLMVFLSARSALQGDDAMGYYQVTPPRLQHRVWADQYREDLTPARWGFAAPRHHRRAAAAMLDGHSEALDMEALQDMRRWCNRADRQDWSLEAIR